MIQAIIFSLKILFSGIILPFRIWQFSKDKLLSQAENNSIKSLLDDDYIVTSWLDWTVDAIIFLMYPIGLIIISGTLLGSLFWSKFSLFGSPYCLTVLFKVWLNSTLSALNLTSDSLANLYVITSFLLSNY